MLTITSIVTITCNYLFQSESFSTNIFCFTICELNVILSCFFLFVLCLCNGPVFLVLFSWIIIRILDSWLELKLFIFHSYFTFSYTYQIKNIFWYIFFTMVDLKQRVRKQDHLISINHPSVQVVQFSYGDFLRVQCWWNKM